MPSRLIHALVALAMLIVLPPLAVPATAQDTAGGCGVVETITYPIDGLTDRGDDFAIYRGKFGGLHTGVDIAFYRYGDPVFAVAPGRVTYADPDGWDTEKGVVIIEHTFPDGSVFYSLYGHMEPIGDYFFPGVGQCVALGDVVGAVGSPSQSAPHLHFEIRDFGPTDGGPGYWDTNPQEAGWQHPLDFIRRWQVRLLNHAGYHPYLSSVSGLTAASVPPLMLSDGGMVTASGNRLEGIGPGDVLLWRMELSDTVTGTLPLPDGRILTALDDGTVMLMRDGRYDAMWPSQADNGITLSGPPLLLGDVVAFFTADNALLGYSADGVLLWGTLPLGERITRYTAGPDRVAVSTSPANGDGPYGWHVVNNSGQIAYQVATNSAAHAAFSPDGGAYLLDGATLYRIHPDYTPEPLTTLPYSAGRSTTLAVDPAGNVTLFMALDETLLYSYTPDGSPRWEGTLPGTHRQPPLLASGDGCLLYALAADGTLYGLNAATGEILGDTRLYAGGFNGQPNARLLDVTAGDRVQFGAGYLTVAVVDGYALAGLDTGNCPAANG